MFGTVFLTSVVMLLLLSGGVVLDAHRALAHPLPHTEAVRRWRGRLYMAIGASIFGIVVIGCGVFSILGGRA